MKKLALLALLLCSLALPAGAQAAGSSQAGYSSEAGVVQSDVAGAHGSGPSAAQAVRGGGSSLPFTGLDVLFVAGMGFLLVGGGFALRRLHGAGARA